MGIYPIGKNMMLFRYKFQSLVYHLKNEPNTARIIPSLYIYILKFIISYWA